MVHLDSDLLGILLALLTFVVPVITSIKEGKRKEKEKQQRMKMQNEIYEQAVREMESEHLFESQEEPAACEMEYRELENREPEKPTVNVVFVEGTSSLPLIHEPVEEVSAPSVSDNEVQDTPSLIDKLRNNPKDAVIMGEILKPKFKEY